jgi:hypothetical protein
MEKNKRHILIARACRPPRRVVCSWTQPAFYNTLTTHCTAAILFHARAAGGSAWYNWKILFSGYAPQYACELGWLDTRLPFAELKRQSHINARA